MRYRRDYKIQYKQRKKSIHRRRRYRKIYALLWLIGSLCSITGIYFGTELISNPDIDAVVIYPDSALSRKPIFITESSADVSQSPESTLPSVSDGKLVAKERGSLITDSRNPSKLPLYDGWTMDVIDLKSKAESLGVSADNIKSWDLDYSQFWSNDTYIDNPGLYGLGDFTNSKPGSRNVISGGSTTGYFKGRTELIQTPVGNVSTYDGRVLFAVPGRIFTDPDLLNDEILKSVRDTCGLDRLSPAGSNRDFSNCATISYNGFENMVHDWSRCVPNNTNWRAVYFDILFDDGTVLAAIMADGKGVHIGYDSRGSYCEDTLMEGYGQVRFKKSNPDTVEYQSLLEIYSPGFKNNGLDIQLGSKKIVGIRTYNVSGNPSKGTYLKWFTE